MNASLGDLADLEAFNRMAYTRPIDQYLVLMHGYLRYRSGVLRVRIDGSGTFQEPVGTECSGDQRWIARLTALSLRSTTLDTSADMTNPYELMANPPREDPVPVPLETIRIRPKPPNGSWPGLGCSILPLLVLASWFSSWLFA